MKSAVEELSPTRVRLTVEVPFDELQPSIQQAYKSIGQQVRIRGFRPGKVPSRLLDQHVGRGTVLQEAVNEALPRFYGDAVRENDVHVLGHPEVDVKEFADGAQLVFTAEVDVRPAIELPEYDALPVIVDDVTVADDELDEQLQNLRERFAVLQGVERPATKGDYVTLDLTATIDGNDVEDARATGLSYEVGSDRLVEGLDDALEGLGVGESRTFPTRLKAGAHTGDEAEATVTVRSVKAKDLPELDDDFAQTASEYDTIGELRDDYRNRLQRVRQLQQGMQARDRTLETLLARVDVPIPEHMLEEEVTYRRQAMEQQLQAAGLTLDAYAESEGKTPEQFDSEMTDAARDAIKTRFVLEAIADKEELGVSQEELTEHLVQQARQYQMPADEFARRVVDGGQLGALMADVLRGKALAFLVEHAVVTDSSGNAVDLSALGAPPADATPTDATPDE